MEPVHPENIDSMPYARLGGDGRRASLVPYIVAVIFVPLLCFALLFWGVTTDWFLRHNDYPFLATIGYGRGLKDVNCQVVMYGDSGAVTGMDPRVVERITHMKACNIAQLGTVRLVDETSTLDLYLSQNARPKYIVFQYHPWEFHRYRTWNDPLDSFIEPIYFLIRYRFNAGTARILITHHRETFQFITWEFNSLARGLFLKSLHLGPSYIYDDAAKRRAEDAGLYSLPLPPETHCEAGFGLRPEGLYYDPEWTNGLRSKYQSKADHVLLNVQPLPDCLPIAALVDTRLKGRYDNIFQTLPINLFNDKDGHYTDQGAAVNSTAIANEILAQEQR